MDDIILVNITDSLSNRITNCELYLDTITEKIANNENGIDIINISLDSISFYLQQLIKSQNESSILNKWGIVFSIIAIIASVCIAIATLCIGNKMEKKRYKRNKLEELKSYKSTIVEWFDMFGKSIKELQDNIVDFANRINKSNELQPEQFSKNLIMLNKLKEISIKEWSEVMVINTKGNAVDNRKDMSCIVYYLEIIVALYDEIQHFYWIYHNRMVKLMDEWNEYFLRLTDNDWKYNCTDSQFLYVLKFHLEQLPETPNMKCYIDCLINPMTQYINDSKNCSIETFTAEIFIRRLNVIVQEWHMHNQGNAKLFREKAQQLGSAYSCLETYINKVKEKEFVDTNNIK